MAETQPAQDEQPRQPFDDASARVDGTNPDDLAALRKARSLLLILLATCRQTQLALDAAGNALDTNLTAELGKMIERTEGQLAAVHEKIDAAG